MYKKSIGLLIIIPFALMLGACSSDDDLETRTFELEEEGIASEVTYYHNDDDEVVKQTTENIIPYDALGLSSKDEAEEMLEAESDEMDDVEGITEEIEYDDDEATEKLEIVYDEIDPDEAEDLSGMMLEGDVENGVSMEKSAEIIEEQGFEEK